MKALVVDDSSVMRKVLKGALERAEITDVVQAKDGQEAVDACRTGTIDLVLMDWNMPNMTGVEAVRTIREEGMTMPIIMVTTEAERNNVIEALKAGADNYIIKPFEPEAMVSKIKSVINPEKPEA